MSLREANEQAGELSAHEIDAVSGGKVLEIPIGAVTIQLNRQWLLGGMERQRLRRRRMPQVS